MASRLLRLCLIRDRGVRSPHCGEVTLNHSFLRLLDYMAALVCLGVCHDLDVEKHLSLNASKGIAF